MLHQKNHRIRIQLSAILLALVLLLGMTGCGSKLADTIDVSTLQETLLSADTSLPDMTTVSSTSDDAESLFAYVSDMDYSKVSSYLLSYSSEGMADEIVVIAVKDSADLETAKQTLETHRQSRVSFYQSYNAGETSRAESGLVFTEGNYAVLIISDNQDAVKTSFEAAVGEA